MSKRGEYKPIDADEVRDLRASGVTWEEVAVAVGVSKPTLQAWRKRAAFADHKRNYHKRARIDETARLLGYSSAAEAIRAMRWDEMTLEEVAARLRVHPRTVTRHYPPELAGQIFVKTEKYERTRRRGQGAWGVLR